MLTDTICEDPRWETTGLANLAERAARATLKHLGYDHAKYEIVVLGCDDDRIAELNADFRGKPQPTNVLSWPQADLAAEDPGGQPAAPGPGELGDIALAYETCLSEARDGEKPLSHHIAHLIVHAVLHLLGYDHIRDPDATLMESLEIEILGKMGLDNPYTGK